MVQGVYLRKYLADHRKRGQGKVLAHGVDEEKNDADRVKSDAQTVAADEIARNGHHSIKNGRQSHVGKDLFERISDGIVFLSREVAQKHGDGVAGHARPGASHVAEARNKQQIARHKH